MLHDLFPEADVVAFHYRGYPPSEGSPGAAALVEDALRIHDFARARLRPAAGRSPPASASAAASPQRSPPSGRSTG